MIEMDDIAKYCGFNTQPPEGGWINAPKGVWFEFVSTLSRPKAAVHATE